jgi:hypothetical protein
MLFALAGYSWGVFTFLLRRWRVAPLCAVAAMTISSALAIAPARLLITGGVLPPVPASTILAQQFFQGAMGGVLGVVAFGGAVRARGAAKASRLAVVHARDLDAARHRSTRPSADPAGAAGYCAGDARPAAGHPRPRATPSEAPGLGRPPPAQRLDQQAERRRVLAAARVVEVVAGEGRAPVGEDANQAAVGEVGVHLVLGQVGEAEAGQHGVQTQGEVGEHELALDPHLEFAASLLELLGVEPAKVGRRMLMQGWAVRSCGVCGCGWRAK